MKEIRVMLVDDHALIREGLAKILALEKGFALVGEAADGEEAVRLAGVIQPDVILMDVNMPTLSGIEASRAIKERYPGIEIIALTIHDDEAYVSALIRAGASGYLLKDVSADELTKAIRRVCSGEAVLHPAISRKALQALRQEAAKASGQEAGLTPRELEVLALVVQGADNRSVASTLFISEKTVKNHLTSIFRKLGVHDRTQAALYAVKQKLVPF